MGSGQAKSATRIDNTVADRAFSTGDSANALIPNLTKASDFYSGVASGNPLQVSRAVGPQVELSRMAYDNAQRQLERTVAPGGVRDQAMTQLQTGQAGDIARIMSGSVDTAYDHLMQLGQFGTQASISSLSPAVSAGDSLARLSAAKASAVGQGISGIASGVGFGVGAKSAKPAAPSSGAPGMSLPLNPTGTAGAGGYGSGYGFQVPSTPFGQSGFPYASATTLPQNVNFPGGSMVAPGIPGSY